MHTLSLLSILAVSSATLPLSSAAPASSLSTKLSVSGISLPLSNSKQGQPITKEDGTVNLASLQRQLSLIRAKYQTTIANYLRNTGDKLGEILEQAEDSWHNASTSAATNRAVREKRQSEAIYNYGNDLLWAGRVGLGTPAQDFSIMFDTGSSDFWVPSADVKCTGCTGNKYDPSLSTTSKRRGGHFAIAYGDGSSSSGPIYSDVVTVGDAYFSAVDQMSDSFADEPEDGIMGMAYASISNIRNRQSEATSRPFGMRLAKTVDGDSELYLGGANEQFYQASFLPCRSFSVTDAPEQGDFEWHAVRKRAYYNISGQVQLGGHNVFSHARSTVIDSGTTLVVASEAEAAAFWASVPGAAAYDDAYGYYTYPCSAAPKLSFTFDGGKAWPVRTVDFNLGRVSYGSKRCVGAVAGIDVGLGDSTWILGGTFLKNVYTVFDPAETHSVGFAKLA
ncbi:hypothetical protein JCM8097_005199 [Rhodosporidiobolus ruineniae]